MLARQGEYGGWPPRASWSRDRYLDATYFVGLEQRINQWDRLIIQWTKEDQQTRELSARLFLQSRIKLQAFQAWIQCGLEDTRIPVFDAVKTATAKARTGVQYAFFACRGSAARMSQDMHRAGFVLPRS